MQEENFSEALSNASKVWAPPRICELLLWLSVQILLNGLCPGDCALCIHSHAYNIHRSKWPTGRHGRATGFMLGS